PDAGAAVAVRRSALVVSDAGTVSGTVVSARVTPEQIRVVVDVDGIGELDAVARLDTHPAAGDRVSMVVDASRLAVTRTRD
ncbi:ABC transporter ATP-binding protein, partial [Nocardioides hankookensis]